MQLPNDLAFTSNSTVPTIIPRLSSNRSCRDKVATKGFDHLSPPSSTSSSNLIHLKIPIYRNRSYISYNLIFCHKNMFLRLHMCYCSIEIIFWNSILTGICKFLHGNMSILCLQDQTNHHAYM